MSSSKYLGIAVELVNRMQNGVYAEKLPPVRQLVQEFNSSIQTVSKSIAVLQQNNIISTARRGGTRINFEHLPHGVIALCTYVPPGTAEKALSSFASLRNEIMSSGFTPVLLPLPSPQERMPLSTQRIFQNNFAGVIFWGSSITLDLCQILEKHQIPYVSANILPEYCQISFVESNCYELLDDLVAKIYAKGYRKIALNFPSPLENYDIICRQEWKKILRKYNLQPTGMDNLISNVNVWDGTVIKQVVKNLLHCAEPPEVLISWGHNYGEVLQEFSKLKNTLVLCAVFPDDFCYCKPPVVKFTIRGNSNRQHKELWKLLQGLMLDKNKTPVHNYLDILELKMVDDLPSADEFRQTIKQQYTPNK